MPTRDDLAGAVAVVTGATGSIGGAIAQDLVASGVHTLAIGRNRAALARLRDEMSGYDADVGAIVGDLGESRQIPRIAEEAWAWRERVDIIINAAGVIRRSSVAEVSGTEWDDTFAVNTRAPFLLTREIGTHMLGTGGGSVVNVASIAGDVVTGAPVAYGASKAALIYLTKYLAVRWAPEIRVNSVAPGYVRTALNKGWLSEDANLRYVLDRTPLDRVGTPDDVVGAVLYLVSPAASYVTGHNLVIDGAWTAQ